MKTVTTLLLALGAIASSFAGSGPFLTIGDPAPTLKTVRWLKGEPIPTFAPGKRSN